MAKFTDYINPMGRKNPIFNKFKEFWGGTPPENKQISTLRPDQEALSQQLVNAGMNPGAGGAFGTAADYYRNNLSDNSADFNAYAAPQMRQFNEEIIPGLSEQFAGMGSGGLSSSGFRNAAVNAGTDLSERLGSIRARLRENAAQGLSGIGQQGLQPFVENTQQPGEGGLNQYVGPALGAVGSAIGGPVLGAIGGAAGSAATSWLNASNKGKSSPYGGNIGNIAANAAMGRFK